MKSVIKLLSISLAVVLSTGMLEMPAYGTSLQEVKTEYFPGDREEGWEMKFPSAPSAASIKLVNTRQWPLSDLMNIEASYNNGSIRLLPGQTQEIVLKEYMTEDNPSYYAKTSVSGTTLNIKHDAIPQPATSYISYMEIYVPESFNGTIRLLIENGILSINGVSASMIAAKCLNGQIGVFNFRGELNCDTENGGIQLSQCEAKGKFHTDNGFLDLSLSKILGDITASSSNGVIAVSLPEASTFTISAATENGNIMNQFSDDWSVSGGMLNGSWGETPVNKILLTNDNGAIELYRTVDGTSEYSAPSNRDLQEYQKWGITRQEDQFYHNGVPIRIFMDLRANNSFRYFSYDKTGTRDIKLIRDQSGTIVSLELISKVQADIILEDIERNS